MTAAETQILQRLESLEQMLMRLLVPVAQQAGRQQARMTNDERKAANKAEREKAKMARQGRKTA